MKFDKRLVLVIAVVALAVVASVGGGTFGLRWI